MEFDAVLLGVRAAPKASRAATGATGRSTTISTPASLHVPDKLALTAVSARARRGPPLRLSRARDARRPDRRRASPSSASAATTSSPCNCRTGGSSRCSISPARASARCSIRSCRSSASTSCPSCSGTPKRKSSSCRRVFRHFDHEAMARGLAKDLPTLSRVIVVGRRRRRRFRCAADDARMGEGARRPIDPDARPARPRRRHPTHLHLRHYGRAQGRDAFGQHGDGQHHPLRRAPAGSAPTTSC